MQTQQVTIPTHVSYYLVAVTFVTSVYSMQMLYWGQVALDWSRQLDRVAVRY